ncbi:MAG: DMT family transporter [Campylobacteraceae bacterium]|nr:DMT family transporter [Campylobacteraceae bacterium]
MSTESPLIKLSNLQNFEVSFLLGICLIISANLILLSQGREFLIQNYKNELKGNIAIGTCVGFSNFFFVLAIIYAGVANTVLILASTPIFCAFFTKILFKTKTGIHLYIATFFIFLGLYVVLYDDLQIGSLIGIIFAFCCTFCMTLMFTLLSYYENASRISYIAIGGLWLVIFSISFISFKNGFDNAFYIVLIGLLIMPFSRYLIGLGARCILPTELSLIMILESVFAPIFAWWWIGDELKSNTLIGGAIIIFSLIIYFLVSKNKQ